MFPLREIDLMGIYIAPFALCLPVAFAATFGALVVARCMPVASRPWRSPWVELGVFTSILSGLVLILGRF